ncbi:thioesterase family protein [Pseudomonas putida]|uniref:thioesterase family protein n=1 Tax=Pseudomonas putida TaxID=303 RepID=UPI0018D94750|nr:thioesterase family protein [Pseudomonas putida]MBH3459260.1 thioesterase family protein [Pseudomonas putida]
MEISERGRAETELPQATAFKALSLVVPEDWIDYNGHMTEWQYYKVMADAGEVFLRHIGFTEKYRLKGYSFFNVQGQQRNLKECRVGTPIEVFTEIIAFGEVRLHLYSYVVDTSRSITLATCEHMMLHVDTNKRAATKMEPYMYACITRASKGTPALQLKGLGMSFVKIQTSQH